MNTTFRSTLGRGFRRAALPLGCYYTVTIALPVANGAAEAGSAFLSHALVVLVLPPILIAMASSIHVAGRALLGAVVDGGRRAPASQTWPTVQPEGQRIRSATRSEEPLRSVSVEMRPAGSRPKRISASSVLPQNSSRVEGK
jgi:hypothetical protein